MSKPGWKQRAHVLFLNIFDVVGDQRSIERIANTLESAYRAGQEEMRERASRLCQDYADTAEAPQPIRWASSANSVAIRALPIGGQDE